MDKTCACDMCDIDLSSDNGYKYVLDELKATRAHIDDIIKVIEMRIEKDAIIDEVLKTNYDDDDEISNDKWGHYEMCINDKESDNKTEDETALDAIIKAIAISNAINGINTTNRRVYPWWSIYPKNMWFY